MSGGWSVFQINRRTDYAVRVMLCLAKRPSGTRLATRTIQEEMQVPRPFLQRIVADLAKAGLLCTHAGPGGGLELAYPAERVNLRHIWEAIEGPLLISDCLTGPGECPLDSGCPVRPRWGRLQAMIVHEKEATTLDQLALEANQLSKNIPVDHLIENMLLETTVTPANAGKL
jgi:Rrf2 family protein